MAPRSSKGRPLTERQQRILDFIKATIREKGYPPSIREIGEAAGLSSTSTVHGHLARLERRGYLHRDATKPRAMELADDSVRGLFRKTVMLPLIGRVTAGVPILAEENREGRLSVPVEWVAGNPENAFLLRVQGDSMIEAGILSGDLVVVRGEAEIVNGDIVVAMIEDEATVKFFFKEPERIRLQPANPHYEPIHVRSVRILGKVIGLMRKY